MLKLKRMFAGRRALALAGLLLLGLSTGCSGREAEKEAKEMPFAVTFFDVGKGDAILVESGGKRMLLDAGYEETAEELLSELKAREIGKLDCLIISHFDKDHVGGADRIVQNFPVDRVLQPDYRADTEQYREYEAALAERRLAPEMVKETLIFSFGGAEVLIYPPQEEAYEEEDNDFSLAVSISYGENRFFFAGDAEKVRLQELLDQTVFDLKHDVLKVPHHGRKEKNSEEFLAAVNPGTAVITCSEEEPADKKVLRALRGLDATVYRTAEGTVRIESDGRSLRAIQE